MQQPILQLQNITKRFGSKLANDGITLTIHPGRVHAIVGENGAGKTTLMNMISGNLQPDEGSIVFDGVPQEIQDPKRADALGIGMVHQHFKLVPSLTVTANIFLGNEIVNRFGQLDVAAMVRRVEELSKRFGLQINPRERVQDLSVGERQRVEIIKALSHDTRLLILDEPTAVLTPAEADEMFVVVRQLAAQGCAVMFISHKLGEVLTIADDVTVIRDGRVVGTRQAAGLAQGDIASMMVGREVLLRIQHTPASSGEEVLRVDGVYAVDPRGVIAVDNLSLSVRRGEIVGIAGVEGNGQSELAAAIAGMYTPPRGTIALAGEDVTGSSVAHRRARGLAYIPEDRHDQGSAPSLSVAENLASTHLMPPISRRGWLSLPAMRAFARGLIDTFDVRGANVDTRISTLSGGNMQKVIIAREFASEPDLLLVSQPTRGVDVGAMEFVHNSIVKVRDQGAGVLLFSADLNEVMSLSDRLLVMYRGRIVAEFTQDDMSETAVGLAMAGIVPTAEALSNARAERERLAQEMQATGAPLRQAAPAADAAVVSVGPIPTATRSAAAPVKESAASPRANVLAEFATRALGGSVQPLLAILVALALGALVILAIGHNPVTAYVELFTSGWRTSYGIANVIAMFIPLAIMAAGTIISFRAGFFNIGGEGQLYFGAFWGAWAGFTFQQLPPVALILLILAVGAVAGALWGLVPGALYAFWQVDIVVVTLLLSQVAMLVTNYLVTGPFQDKSAGMVASAKISESAMLPMFSAAYGVGPDLLLALGIAVAMGLVLNRTPWGLKVKQLGEMNRFAEYAGVSTKAMSIQVMMVSGAVCGVAGALYVVGPNGGRFLQAFSPGFGFLAITVALLARLNPWASLLAALFYSTMMAGGTGLQTAGVPFPLVNVLQGLIIIAITATFILNRSWRRKRTRGTQPVSSSKGEPK